MMALDFLRLFSSRISSFQFKDSGDWFALHRLCSAIGDED
jgi:hypothetical protein